MWAIDDFVYNVSCFGSWGCLCIFHLSSHADWRCLSWKFLPYTSGALSIDVTEIFYDTLYCNWVCEAVKRVSSFYALGKYKTSGLLGPGFRWIYVQNYRGRVHLCLLDYMRSSLGRKVEEWLGSYSVAFFWFEDIVVTFI